MYFIVWWTSTNQECHPSQSVATNTSATKLVQRFEEMKRKSNSIDDDEFRDLPALECGECGRLVSFGGCANLLEHQFTVDTVCRCNL